MRHASMLAIAQMLSRTFGPIQPVSFDIQPVSFDIEPEQAAITTGRRGTKHHQRAMSKRKAQRRAKRLGHY